eukprot:2033460-Alexandrium_andersonii.AAC.1
MIGGPEARPSRSARLGAWLSRTGRRPAMSQPPDSPAPEVPPFAPRRAMSLAVLLLAAWMTSRPCPLGRATGLLPATSTLTSGSLGRRPKPIWPPRLRLGQPSVASLLPALAVPQVALPLGSHGRGWVGWPCPPALGRGRTSRPLGVKICRATLVSSPFRSLPPTERGAASHAAFAPSRRLPGLTSVAGASIGR